MRRIAIVRDVGAGLSAPSWASLPLPRRVPTAVHSATGSAFGHIHDFGMHEHWQHRALALMRTSLFLFGAEALPVCAERPACHAGTA